MTFERPSEAERRRAFERAALRCYMTREAWEGLVERALEYGYLRTNAPGTVPRGMGGFVNVLSTLSYTDTRPHQLRDTDQWHKGDRVSQHTFKIAGPEVIVALGNIALEFNIWPFRTQKPVVNGYRQRMMMPMLIPRPTTPGVGPGTFMTVSALVGPVLEAYGLGWLTPTTPVLRSNRTWIKSLANQARVREMRRAQKRSLKW